MQTVLDSPQNHGILFHPHERLIEDSEENRGADYTDTAGFGFVCSGPRLPRRASGCGFGLLRYGGGLVVEFHPLAVELGVPALDLVRIGLGFRRIDPDDTEVLELDLKELLLAVWAQEHDAAAALFVFGVVALDHEVLVPGLPGCGTDLGKLNL